jgi:hypothetical protein
MSKKKRRNDNLRATIEEYAESRTFDLKEFSGIHMRLTDSGFTSMDIWPTTGRYYITMTNYIDQTDKSIVERGGEKGLLPFGDEIYKYLDRIFFAAEM